MDRNYKKMVTNLVIEDSLQAYPQVQNLKNLNTVSGENINASTVGVRMIEGNETFGGGNALEIVKSAQKEK